MTDKQQDSTMLDIELLRRQGEAWDRFWDPRTREVMYGGAKGGGKSVLLCTVMYVMALAVIKQHKLKPTRKTIPHIAWMGRKVGSDFVATTLQTWQQLIPSQAYRICAGTERQPKHILIADRIAIDFGGLDNRNEVAKFNSAEYAVIAVDQAEETDRDDVGVLRASRRFKMGIGRMQRPWLTYNKDTADFVGTRFNPDHDGKPYAFKGLWTTNPRDCWCKQDFIDSPQKYHEFVPALPKDNKHLSEDYLETLEQAFAHRPDLLRAYRDGDWTIMTGADQVIQPQWLAIATECGNYEPGHKYHVAVDPAREGDDEAVIYAFDWRELIAQDVSGACDLYALANRIVAMCRRVGAYHATIETTGGDVGAGAIDIVRQIAPDIHVMEYCPGGSASEVMVDPYASKGTRQVYGNLRSEIWNYVARLFTGNHVPLPTKIMDYSKGGLTRIDDLRQQLCWPRYEERGAKTWIESKKSIKDRKHRSPDRADAFVIGLWAEQFVRTQEAIQEVREQTDQYAEMLRMVW